MYKALQIYKLKKIILVAISDNSNNLEKRNNFSSFCNYKRLQDY